MINHTDILAFGDEIRDAPHDGEAMFEGVVYRKVHMRSAPYYSPCNDCPLDAARATHPATRACALVMTPPGGFPCNVNIPDGMGGVIVPVSIIPRLTLKGYI